MADDESITLKLTRALTEACRLRVGRLFIACKDKKDENKRKAFRSAPSRTQMLKR